MTGLDLNVTAALESIQQIKLQIKESRTFSVLENGFMLLFFVFLFFYVLYVYLF